GRTASARRGPGGPWRAASRDRSSTGRTPAWAPAPGGMSTSPRSRPLSPAPPSALRPRSGGPWHQPWRVEPSPPDEHDEAGGSAHAGGGEHERRHELADPGPPRERLEGQEDRFRPRRDDDPQQDPVDGHGGQRRRAVSRPPARVVGAAQPQERG